jgi:potassium efflux system protein
VVNISQFEGIVTHIGIRSLTLTTSENQEVIMPNSELLSRAFVNLTHSDSSVRTTLYITTSYDDDPHKVVQILRDILYENAEVLKEPPSQALLWDFGDFSVKYRIDFFVNLQKASRSQVRSQLFMTIWDRFKTAGITMPYPRREIYMKTEHDSELTEKRSYPP